VAPKDGQAAAWHAMSRIKRGNGRRNGEQSLEEIVSNVKQWLEGMENNGRQYLEKVEGRISFLLSLFLSKAGIENEIGRWTKKFWRQKKLESGD
jgi:hypothetical protein